jgi:hypothetical protein
MQSAIPRGEEEPGLEDQLRHTHTSDDNPFPLWNNFNTTTLIPTKPFDSGGLPISNGHQPPLWRIPRAKGWTSCDIANRGAISQTDSPHREGHRQFHTKPSPPTHWAEQQMVFSTPKPKQHHTPIRGRVKGTRNPGREAWNSLFSCSRQSLQTDFFISILSRRKIFVVRQHRTR